MWNPLRTSSLALAIMLCGSAISSRATEPLAAGIYYGLLEGDSYETSGSVRVVLNRRGNGSVSVKLGAEKACVVLVGMLPGSGELVVRRIGDPDMQIDLRLVQLPDGRWVVEGAVTDGGAHLPVLAAGVTVSSAANSPRGRYNFALGEDEESDAGGGSVLITRHGAVRGVARLADGRPITVGGRLDADGRWPFLAALRGQVSVTGHVDFAETAETDCAGTLTRRFADAIEPDSTLDLIGSAYAPGDSLLPPAGYSWGVTVNVATDAGETLAFSTRLNAIGRFPTATFGTDELALNLAPRTGLLTGTLRRADGSKSALHGAIIPSKAAAGGFLCGGIGGTFHLVLDGASASPGTLGGVTMTMSNFNFPVTLTSGNLVKTGAGTLTLSGTNTNTYTGGTTISGGTLQINTGNTGTLNSGVTLTGGGLTGGIVNGGTLTLTGGVTSNWAPNDPNTAITWVNNLPNRTTDLHNLNGNNPPLTVNGGTLTIGNTGGSVILTRGGLLNSGNGLGATNERGEPIDLQTLADGDFVFIGGQRFRTTRSTPDGPVQLIVSPAQSGETAN